MPFVIGFLTAAVLTPGFSIVARRTGLVDRPDGTELKIHEDPIPLAGGFGIVVGIVVGTWIAGPAPILVLAACLLGLVVGTVDDAVGLPVWARILALTVAGGVLLSHLSSSLPDETLPGMAAVVVVLTLACANGVNLLDGQNGLAGGVAAIACLGLSFSVGAEAGLSPAIGAAAAGATAGFVVWNWPKARTFLGDAGAYVLGIVLAAQCASVIATYGARGLVLAGVCVGLLLFDLVFTVVRRALVKGSLVTGDRGHSYDLIALRLGRDLTTVIYWATGAGLALLSVWLRGAGVTSVVITTFLSIAAGIGAGVALWRRRDDDRSD